MFNLILFSSIIESSTIQTIYKVSENDIYEYLSTNGANATSETPSEKRITISNFKANCTLSEEMNKIKALDHIFLSLCDLWTNLVPHFISKNYDNYKIGCHEYILENFLGKGVGSLHVLSIILELVCQDRNAFLLFLSRLNRLLSVGPVANNIESEYACLIAELGIKTHHKNVFAKFVNLFRLSEVNGIEYRGFQSFCLRLSISPEDRKYHRLITTLYVLKISIALEIRNRNQ